MTYYIIKKVCEKLNFSNCILSIIICDSEFFIREIFAGFDWLIAVCIAV